MSQSQQEVNESVVGLRYVYRRGTIDILGRILHTFLIRRHLVAMGTLTGHILPGSFFIAFGIWHTWALFHRYFICRRNISNVSFKQRKRTLWHRNTASYVCMSCSSKLHMEGIIKVLGTTIGFIGELYTAFNSDGEFVNFGNGQHMAMYFFFGLNGVIDILQFHGLNIIPDMDYMTALLALFVEVFLFANHLHGRSPMDVQIHTFLVVAVIASMIGIFLEMKHRYSVLPALTRIFFTLLQGTWFYQVGFILYPPSGVYWDENDHRQMMLTTTLFTCHCAALFIFMSISAVLIYLRVRAMELSAIYETISIQNNGSMRHNGTNKYGVEQIENIMADTDEDDTGL